MKDGAGFRHIFPVRSEKTVTNALWDGFGFQHERFVRKDFIVKLISIDTTKCVKCKACAEVCPMGIIEISSNGFPEPKSSAYRLCINCGYCVDVCAFDALNHKVRKRSAGSTAAALKRYQALRKKRKEESDEK